MGLAASIVAEPLVLRWFSLSGMRTSEGDNLTAILALAFGESTAI
jgi:hypothetical protein